MVHRTTAIRLLLFSSLLAGALLFAPAQDAAPAVPDAPAPAPSRALQLPDISVIGNTIGFVSNRDDAEGDDHLTFRELELVFGANVYPGIRGDAVVALHEPEFPAEVEEAYATIEQFSPRAPIGGRVGITRLPFGKVNPIHPHQLPTVDTPAAIANLLGDEFIGNGFEVTGLLPTKGNLFLNWQLGRWSPRAHHHDEEEEEAGDEHAHELGAGFDDTFTLGRLWTGWSPATDHELELGISGAVGDGESHEDGDVPEVTLWGADLTWRHWLAGERRLLLQAEAVRRTADSDDGRDTRNGYYLLGSYRPNTRWEFGSRYDWSEAPGDEGEHEQYLSLFGTRFLNETTFVRLQVKHGDTLEGDSATEAFLQFVFGFGPHAHALQ